jgi:hypothetical protein
MSAISYVISLGQTLEQVTTGTNAPASGSIELRMDTTGTSVTDAAYAGGTRALCKGEIYTLLKIIEQKLINDPNVLQ